MISGLPDATKYRAGPLSAMVTLCLALNDRAAAADTLKKAVKHQQVLTSFKVRIEDHNLVSAGIFSRVDKSFSFGILRFLTARPNK